MMLAMLLTVSQASTPIPGKAPNSTAQTSKKIKQNSTRHEKPTAQSPTAVNAAATQNSQSKSATKGAESQSQTVSVREFPSMSIKRDRADWIAWGGGIALVIVGGCGVLAALKTLRSIETQTRQMKEYVIATKDGVKAAQASAEAAIISAKAAQDTLYLTQAADIQIEGINLTPKGPITGDTEVVMVVRNFGPTAAEDLTSTLTLGIKGRPLGPVNPRSDIPVAIGAGQPFNMGFERLRHTLTTEDLAMVLAERLELRIWGAITYKDVFGGSYVIDCEGTYRPKDSAFYIERYSRRKETKPN